MAIMRDKLLENFDNKKAAKIRYTKRNQITSIYDGIKFEKRLSTKKTFINYFVGRLCFTFNLIQCPKKMYASVIHYSNKNRKIFDFVKLRFMKQIKSPNTAAAPSSPPPRRLQYCD